MKVMCIDEVGQTNPNMKVIPFGEIVNATQCPVYPQGLDIAEYPVDLSGRLCAYNRKHFIPLSDIDETEMVREYGLVKAE